MPKVLRPIGHEERLSIVDHLDELRTRLFVSVAVLGVAFAVCFWQNQPLIHLLNKALPHTSSSEVQHSLAGVQDENANVRQGLMEIYAGAAGLATAKQLSATERADEAQVSRGALKAARALPRNASTQEKPITIGVGEPFMTTMVVAAYFALLFTLPVLLYELYAFVIPALKPDERHVAVPVMGVAPLLFLGGVVFGYLVVLPPAVHFLQGYNSNEFDALVQAKTYYEFEILTMLGIGLAFQTPLALLALQKIGAINSSTLTKNWRYATVIIAVIAAAMPGADPVTTALEMLPLVLLYLASIVLLKIVDRRAAARAAAEIHMDDGLDPT